MRDEETNYSPVGFVTSFFRCLIRVKVFFCFMLPVCTTRFTIFPIFLDFILKNQLNRSLKTRIFFSFISQTFLTDSLSDATVGSVLSTSGTTAESILPRRASLSSASAEFLPFLLSKHLLISLTN